MKQATGLVPLTTGSLSTGRPAGAGNANCPIFSLFLSRRWRMARPLPWFSFYAPNLKRPVPNRLRAAPKFNFGAAGFKLGAAKSRSGAAGLNLESAREQAGGVRMQSGGSQGPCSGSPPPLAGSRTGFAGGKLSSGRPGVRPAFPKVESACSCPPAVGRRPDQSKENRRN
jgi:hypothetical protein